MRLHHLAFSLCLATAACFLTSCRETEWTKKDVIEWYAKIGSSVRGGLGYQGSDEKYHHFIARVFDEWVFVQMKREELKLDDERPFSSAPLAFYAVDPSHDFQKIEEKSGADHRPDGSPVKSPPSNPGQESGVPHP